MTSDTGITTILGGERTANKNVPGGYAGLGADGFINPLLFNKQIAASTNNKYGSAAFKWSYGGGTYIPLLTLTLTDKYYGVMTTSFYLSDSSTNFSAFAYVALNGVQIGTTRSVLGVTQTQFNENTQSIHWEVGDKLEIYGMSNGGYVRVNDFYLQFDVESFLIGAYRLAVIL